MEPLIYILPKAPKGLKTALLIDSDKTIKN